MSFYDVLGSGMSANKTWMDVTANNITNINTTRTQEGGPYHRQSVYLQAKSGDFEEFFNQHVGNGVEIGKVVEDKQEKLVYNPEHPDADKDGNVRMPSINLAAEMTNLMMGQRAYEANVSALNSMKQANEKTLEIGKG